MGHWMPYKELDWDNPEFKAFHIDTRDFNGLGNDHNPTINFVKKKARHKPENYFFTKEQIIELLDRYYTESGGPGEWRMFCLEGEGAERAGNWQLKYIRIYRTKYGFVVYDDKQKFLFPKRHLNCAVAQEHLNHH